MRPAAVTLALSVSRSRRYGRSLSARGPSSAGRCRAAAVSVERASEVGSRESFRARPRGASGASGPLSRRSVEFGRSTVDPTKNATGPGRNQVDVWEAPPPLGASLLRTGGSKRHRPIAAPATTKTSHVLGYRDERHLVDLRGARARTIRSDRTCRGPATAQVPDRRGAVAHLGRPRP